MLCLHKLLWFVIYQYDIVKRTGYEMLARQLFAQESIFFNRWMQGLRWHCTILLQQIKVLHKEFPYIYIYTLADFLALISYNFVNHTEKWSKLDVIYFIHISTFTHLQNHSILNLIILLCNNVFFENTHRNIGRKN